MKNSCACPKCGGADIIKIEGNVGPYGTGNNIPTGWKYTKVHRYLCCSCGYSEEWIDREDIEKIKKKYAGE